MGYLSVPPTISQSILIFLFLSSMSLWVLGLAPPLAAAIYLLLGLIFLSLAPHEVTLSGFYSDTFFLLISLFMLGSFIQASGLSYRALLYLCQFNRNSKSWKQFVMFLSGAVLTPVIPSANGRVLITHTLFQETTKIFNIPRGSLEHQRLMASTIGGFSLLSPIFLTSKSINLLAFGMLPEQVQQDFQFFYWLVAAAVAGVLILAAHVLLTAVLFKNNETYHIDPAAFEADTKALGRMTAAEFGTIGAIILFISIIFTKSIHQLDAAWLALFLLVFAPLIMGFFEGKRFNRTVEWDFLIILSALIGFSNTMIYLEMDDFITYYLKDLRALIERDFIIFSVYLSLAIFVLRLMLPINVVVTVLCSTLIPLTLQSTINPWIVVFSILLLSETSTNRVTTSYLILFFSLDDDTSHYWRLTVLQLLMHFVKLGALIVSIPVWRNLGLI